MLETKEQKRYLATVVVLILILGLVSFWHKSDFRYKDTKDYSKPSQSVIEANAYLDYLESLKIDPKASQELFEKVLTQDDVKKEVEAALEIDQTITPPAIDQKQIKTTAASGQQAVVDYLTATMGPITEYNGKAAGLNESLFAQDAAAADQAKAEFAGVYGKILGVDTPKEALDMQESLLTAYAAYGELLDSSKSYATGENVNPWPNVYRDYVVINDSLKKYGEEFKKLDDKYQLASLPDLHYVVSHEDVKKSGFSLIPVAHAGLIPGVPDLMITIGDIPSLVKDGIEQGLAASFSQFMGSFIQQLIQKIESNYMVANFLYYSDALINGQYANDYLNKYVADPLDRRIIKTFIPQFNCGQNQDLRPLFAAKANQYLGFDPENLDPKDPDYYQKMAQVGNFLASPNGWATYYQSMADQAASEAEKAADKELTSSGLKTPRDIISNNIAKSINSIVSSERASLTALMQLGGQNAKSFISGFIAQLTQNLMNNFVFSGVTGTDQPGVFKEQATCLAAAQIQLVVPVTGTKYQQPSTGPSEEQIYNETCAKYPGACQNSASSTGGVAPR